MTTVTFDAVKSPEQMAAESKQEQPEAKPSGGLSEQKPRATVMTSTVEVLKLSTDVNDADLRIPADFKETK